MIVVSSDRDGAERQDVEVRRTATFAEMARSMQSS
jgi:hypothetical protein